MTFLGNATEDGFFLTRRLYTGVDFVGSVFNDLNLLPLPDLLFKTRPHESLQWEKMIAGMNFWAYLSSVLEIFVLALTSHSFTVQSADPEARRVPSQLRRVTERMPQFRWACRRVNHSIQDGVFYHV